MNKSDIDKKDLKTYFGTYLKIVPDLELIEALNYSKDRLVNILNSLTEEKLNYRYDKDKWTIKEIFLHIIDNERIFINRALRFSRDDKTELPGYNHADYILPAEATSRNINDLIEEFETLRQSSIIFFKNLTTKMLQKNGKAGGTILSVGSIGYLLVGHDIHHTNVIEERYI